MSLGNWQRDLLRIALYVTGVVMFVVAIPDVVAYIFAYCEMLSARRWILQWHGYTVPTEMVERLRQTPIAAPVARMVAGVSVAACAGWLSRKVFPDQPEEES